MEEKQLDFNQPLLSVRRFSPKVASETEKKSKTSSNSSIRLPPPPSYKSDLKSGPVSHPGAVPFVWEHTPGRPKNEGKLPTLSVEQPPLTPNLPPGMASRVKHHQDSDQVCKGIAICKSATKQKILKEVMQEKDSSGSEDDGGEEAYQDALDTLSTTESFFMNCSASGLSGLEDDQETHPFGSFSSDQQARSFMIGRFLPAAKAIASGSPQYTSRKPPVVQEEPQQVKEVVLVSRKRYSPLRQIVLSQYARDDIGEEESEDEDDNESDGSENNATKVCRLFPRLCFLNPLLKLRMEGRVLSSAATHNGTRKEHARTSHREKKSVYSQYGFREEKVKKNGSSKLSACESTQCDFGSPSPVVEKTLYIDSVHKDKSHSDSSSSAMKGQTIHTWGDPFEASIKVSGNCKKPSIILPRSSESLDVEVDLKSLLASHSTDQEFSKGISNGEPGLENQCQRRRGNEEAINLRLPLSLPSPKAPSESWLKRTLPTISSSNVTAKIPAPSRIINTATHDPKWERIVKCSEELLTTVSED